MRSYVLLRVRQAGAACLMIVAAAQPAAAQNVTYTELQATQGAAAYAAGCARCHGAEGQGAEGTALKGDQFDAIWRGQPAKELFSFIKEYMPADKAGTLRDADVIVFLAHILKLNNVPAGAQPLVADPTGIIPAK